MRVKKKQFLIPPSVWRKCNRELQLHDLHKKALDALKQEIYDEYQSPGELKETRSGGGSIYKSKTDAALRKLTSQEIMQLEMDVQAIDDAIDSFTDTERQFYVLHYRKHNSVGDCAWKMSYSRQSVTKIKRRIIEKTAVRLGYIR